MNRWLIRVQRASVDDAEEILRLQKTAFMSQAVLYSNFNLPPLHQSLAALQEEFGRKIFLKALMQKKIAGSVRFEQINGVVAIERLIVDPACQNQGVGSSLLAKVEAVTPSAHSYRLFTGSKSQKNIHIYQKLGYQITRRETSRQNIELLHLEKSRSQSGHKGEISNQDE